jgi:hypothetical protein
MLESDQLRIRNNVAEGFRGLLNFIQGHAEQSYSEIDRTITVASEVWTAGEGDLATSLLLDALIRLYQKKLSPQ